jgi:D-sedoheptulose 7-phosphate isomerase
MSHTTKEFEQAIARHLEVIQSLHSHLPVIERIASLMSDAILAGKKIVWCGNGGSAADAQHLAAELVGRFLRERRGLPSIALTTNTSILTAVGNDLGYDQVFSRQVEALCVAGDVLVGISTSGNSRNVCAALETAQGIGVRTIAFTGEGGGQMTRLAEVTLAIPSLETPRIQEAQILCGHMICDYIERSVVEADQEATAIRAR